MSPSSPSDAACDDADPPNPAARTPVRASLREVHRSVRVPQGGRWLARLAAFTGPGYMISVGYMDPGNWATDIAGGARFGYALLSVVLLSNLMAVVLQALAARLGIVTGRDLAQLCREEFSRPVGIFLWLACEIAIVACDLAEVIGTAIALKLLFGLPLTAGAIISALDAMLVLGLMNHGFRYIEAFVIAMLTIIALCFALQIAAAAPPIAAMLAGFVPVREIVTDKAMLYVAIGIVGATVMPHNLYLHSSIVQTRAFEETLAGRRDAIRWATMDSTIALTFALFVNAAILILAAATFHASGRTEVAEIEQAFELLSPLLGLGIASTLFAVALLASGINSTVTATLAGQIVMEGFVHLRLPPWARRLLTRAIAIVPVVVVTSLYGDAGVGKLLVFSQVLLSMQLPFAVIPLVRFVSQPRLMGALVAPRALSILAWAIATVLVALNGKLLFDTVFG